MDFFCFNSKPEFNNFSTKGSEFAKVSISRNPQLWIKSEITDVSKNKVELVIKDYQFINSNQLKNTANNNINSTIEMFMPMTKNPEYNINVNNIEQIRALGKQKAQQKKKENLGLNPNKNYEITSI